MPSEDYDSISALINLKKIFAINQKLNSTFNLDELLGIVMTTASEVIGAEAASLMLLDEKKSELVFKIALGEKGIDLKQNFKVRLGEGIAGFVAESGQTIVVNDVQSDPRFAQRFDRGTGFTSKAILCVPIRTNEKIIGILEAINPKGKKNFTPGDVESFEIFATQVAIAIENSRIHNELLKQERAQYELKVAHEIQQNFLPELEKMDLGIDIAARSIPAKDIGGDFYDITKINDHLTGILIGDVSGKGVPAALYMIRVISDFRHLASEYKNPGNLLSKLNNIMAQESQFGMFVTALYMIIDKKNKTCHYSSAGHLPIIKRNGSSEPIIFSDGVATPLGVEPDCVYPEKTIPFQNGDSFLIYTDGMNEARNPKGIEYSIEKLKKYPDSLPSNSKEYIQLLFQDLEEFTEGKDPHDDMTALAVFV